MNHKVSFVWIALVPLCILRLPCNPGELTVCFVLSLVRTIRKGIPEMLSMWYHVYLSGTSMKRANQDEHAAHFSGDRMTNPLHCLLDRFEGNGSSICPLKLQFHLMGTTNGFQSNPSLVVQVCTATLTILTTVSRIVVPWSSGRASQRLAAQHPWWLNRLSSRHSVSSCSQWYPQICS